MRWLGNREPRANYRRTAPKDRESMLVKRNAWCSFLKETTLVDVLITVAILGILAALLL